MMRRITLLLVLSISVPGCMTPSKSKNDQLGVVPNQSLSFPSPEARREAERKALAGDTTAATALAECSYYVDNDIEQAKRWYKVGASFGDKLAAKNLKTLENITRHGSPD